MKTFDNDKWHLVIGVDHVTSSFLQLWEQPWEEHDMALLVVDNQGVRVSEDEETGEVHEMPAGLAEVVRRVTKQFELSRRSDIPYPNLDWETANEIAKAAGFEDIGGEICEAFD